MDLDGGIGLAGPLGLDRRRFSHEAMNTVFEVHLANADPRYAAEAAQAAFALVDRLEGELSRFRPNSDITRINHLAAGESVRVGEAALKVHHNEGEGKIGVLCLAPEAGQGITDPEKRAAIGEDKITLYQRHARGEL